MTPIPTACLTCAKTLVYVWPRQTFFALSQGQSCATVLRSMIRIRTQVQWPKLWSPTSTRPCANACRSGRAVKVQFAPLGGGNSPTAVSPPLQFKKRSGCREELRILGEAGEQLIPEALLPAGVHPGSCLTPRQCQTFLIIYSLHSKRPRDNELNAFMTPFSGHCLRFFSPPFPRSLEVLSPPRRPAGFFSWPLRCSPRRPRAAENLL